METMVGMSGRRPHPVALSCRDRGFNLTVHTRQGQPFRPSQLKKVRAAAQPNCMVGCRTPAASLIRHDDAVETHTMWLCRVMATHKAAPPCRWALDTLTTCRCCLQVAAHQAAIVVLLHPEGAPTPADAEALKAAAGMPPAQRCLWPLPCMLVKLRAMHSA